MKTTILALTATGILLFSCKPTTSNSSSDRSKKETKTPEVTQNFNVSNLQPDEYETVDAIKGGTVTFKSGSQVTFPNNCFETMEGKEVQGKVLVRWKEYHSLGEIMCSDIEMRHKDGVLSSGGMFEIDGTDQNHNPIRIKADKSYTVELLSDRKGIEFPFLTYDLTSKTWEETPCMPESKEKKSTKSQSVTPTTESVLTKKNGQIFNIPVSVRNYPEFKDDPVIGWYTEDETQFPALKSQQVEENVFLGKILKKNENGSYVIEIKRGKQRIQYEAVPVTVKNQGEYIDQEAVAKNEQMKKYVDDIRDGKTKRTATLNNFGTYNWDILHAYPDNEPIFYRFQHGDHILDVSKAFFVIPSKHVSVPLRIKGDKFHLLPGEKSGLVMIYPNNTLAIISGSDIKTLTKDQKSGKTLIFDKSSIHTFDDVKDIDVLINKFI